METLEQGYIDYLKYKRYTERTIKNKLGHLKHYTDWLESEQLEITQCSYSDIMGFVKQLQRDKRSIASQNLHLRAIRQLYEGLILNEQSTSNRFISVRIKAWLM